MKVSRQFLTIFTAGAILTLAGCGGGGGGGNNDAASEPTAESRNANIALYGDFDSNKTSEKSLDNGNGALLLDDDSATYAAFGMDMGSGSDLQSRSGDNKVQSRSSHVSANLKSHSDFVLGELKAILQNQGAALNTLVDEYTINAQGDVRSVVLDADISGTGSSESASSVRNLLLEWVNEGTLTGLPQFNAPTDQFRVTLACMLENDQNVICWVAAFNAAQANTVTASYGDLNNGSGATSYQGARNARSGSDRFTQSAQTSNGVDILWVIDNSGSMSEEQTNLADGANQFFNSLGNAGVDYRLAATTTDGSTCQDLRTLSDGTSEYITPGTANAADEWGGDGAGIEGIARPGTGGSATETGFYCADKVDRSGFDRAGAEDLVIFVSDEPENETVQESSPAGTTSYTNRDFATYEQNFTGTGATYFAIAGTSSEVRNTFSDTYDGTAADFTCNGDGGSATGGAHFSEIATVTGGSSASICANATSWSVMFEQIIQTATGLASSYELSYTPLPNTIQVTVDGSSVSRDVSHSDGFDVIQSANTGARLVFYGSALPDPGDSIQVSYDYVQ